MWLSSSTGGALLVDPLLPCDGEELPCYGEGAVVVLDLDLLTGTVVDLSRKIAKGITALGPWHVRRVAGSGETIGADLSRVASTIVCARGAWQG